MLLIAGFVFNHNLTAVSQYCYFQFFDFLPKCKDQIQHLLTTFYENEIKNTIPHNNYVIDFAICKNPNNNSNDSEEINFADASQWRVMVIELNPYFTDTGACMFSWKNKSDTAIITGEQPFQFRVLEHTVEYPLDCFNYTWRDFINEYQGRGKRKTKSNNENNSNNNQKGCRIM